MSFQGKIYLEDDRYVVDAAPHIMARIRALFDNGATYSYKQGVFTHKPVYLPMTMATARDLVWLCDRYPIEIDSSISEKVNAQAAEYERILTAVSDADKDKSYNPSPESLKMALPPREHQITFRNMALKVRRMLLGDVVGLGKTASGILLLTEPENRPALVVCPTTLCNQWKREIERFLPEARVHIIVGHKNYPLPPADVYITAYTRLSRWQDVLVPFGFKTLIFDEVQELRHTGTSKRDVARAISKTVTLCAGLSGTPIINYGSEIWSVVDAISPDSLGGEQDFLSEWCFMGKVREPVMLNSYLKSVGLFLRRAPEDVGLSFGEASKHIYTLDSDLETLKACQDVMKKLAITMLSGAVGESDSAGRQFDYQLRHATGVAKAKPTAEFVKLLLDEERKVILVGYHHDVYSVWEKELANFNPVRITGHETPTQKDAAARRFVEDDDCRLLLLSVRCAAGIDGLQHVCKTMVFGELDWSPHMMDQNVGRLLRDGQKHHVQVFFLTVNDGADPFMLKTLNLKRSQHDGLIEGREAEASFLETDYSKDRVREMAAAYLQSIGEEVPVPVVETGLLAQVATALRWIRLPVNTEAEMQEALWKAIQTPGFFPEDAKVEREVKIGARSRVDFVASRGEEKIAIECKINSTGKSEVYRQVRRYTEEIGITSAILLAPWSGVSSFIVDKTSVVVVDFSLAGI